MSNLRDLSRRIDSITNTRQITRTMEMVSTARVGEALERASSAAPYKDAIKRMLAEDRPRTIRLLLSGRQLLSWRQQREIIAGLPHRWPWQRGCNRVLSLLLSAHQMMLR